MKRFSNTWLVLFLVFAPTLVLAADGPTVAMREKHRAVLQTYCVKCHNAEKSEAKFRLDNLPFVIANLETAERWQKILNALNSGEMPPPDEKQLTKDEKTDLLEELSNVMVAARKSLGDRHGEITMRRLNRREYRNSLRELLGVEINVSELPADTGNGGFDTVGSNLFMSGNQFEQYLALGREALDEAFEWQAAAGAKQHLRYEAEESLAVALKLYEANLDALARAERWAAEVDAAAAKPENAAIVAEIRKASKNDDVFRRSWKKIAGAPPPEDFGFKTVENNADKAARALNYKNGYFRPYHEYYQKQPHLDTGAYLTIHGGNELPNDHFAIYVPPKWPVGNYIVRVRVGATANTPADRHFFEFGIHPRHGQVMSTHQVTGTIAAPQVIEIPLKLTRKHASRDDRTIFIREKGTADHFTQTRAKFGAGKTANGIGPELAIWVDWMEIERVADAAAPQSPGIVALGGLAPRGNRPGAGAASDASEIRLALERFSQAAFRGRTPPPTYIEKLVSIYDAKLNGGVKQPDALKDALAIVLSSPMFLYISEPQPETVKAPAKSAPTPLAGPELAARLSYFLWGAPPDETLLALARSGELQQPAVLAAQANRLLDDPRAFGFTRPFVYQWLGLDRLDFFEFNRTLYPRFDSSTKLAARDEVYETFEHLLRHNRSARDLLKADYVVINGVLASYYGIENVAGDAFRPVTVPPDSPRGGLLGMAAIMAMGGNGEKSNPVERGAWVLRKMLNDPPPPAPANVPQIARLAGKLLTTRERLIAHQEEPQCANCHRKIDPIGFGLENFDAVGQWRTTDSYQLTDANGKPDPKAKKTWTIDAAAAFHHGASFDNFFQLRDIIATKSVPFARGLSVALIEYALGRPVGFTDEPLIEEMVTASQQKDFAMREFIYTLIKSQAFRSK